MALNYRSRKYLSDPIEDVRIATENLLADFLREIRDVSVVQKRYEEQIRLKREAEIMETIRRDPKREELPDITAAPAERAAFIPENDVDYSHDIESTHRDEATPETRDTGGTCC
jgi:vacuole morphology and inheritance protein 14